MILCAVGAMAWIVCRYLAPAYISVCLLPMNDAKAQTHFFSLR